MKILNQTPNVINSVKFDKKSDNKQVSFRAEYQQTPQIQSVTPDYNISVPMPYSYTGDLKISDSLTAKTYKMANGQKVIILPKKGATVIKTYVNTGSFNEPDNVRGISHYIEHNLFNGSEALGDKEFFKEVDKMGARTNASTSFSTTDYYIESNLLDDNDLENQIKLQAAQLETPKFLLEKLEKEKDIVNSEINMYMSDDDTKAYSQTIKNLFNIQSTSKDLVAGTTDNITALTRDDVVKYYNDNYYPANMITVITGDVEPDKTMALVSKYFNSTKMPSNNRKYEQMTPIQSPVRQDFISEKNENSSLICIGLAGPENNNALEQKYLQALSMILFSIKENRGKDLQKKYATKVYSDNERLSCRPSDKTFYSISANLSEKDVEPMLKDLYKVINGVITNPPTEDEMNAVKHHLLKRCDERNQYSEWLNFYIGGNALDGTENQIYNEKQIINNMTSQDLVNVARKYLDLNKAALTVVHPKNSNTEAINSNYKNSSVSFTGAMHKKPLDLSNVTKYTINGYDVILNDVDSDYIDYSLKYSKEDYKTRKPALKDVVNEMLKLNGTNSRTEKSISKFEDENGISKYEYITSNQYCIGSEFPTTAATEGLDNIKDKVNNQEFTQELLDKAIKNCAEEYSRTEPNAYENFDNEMYGKKLNTFSLEEKKEGLKNITLDDVKTYYDDITKNTMGQLVISGPFSKQPELKNRIFNEIATYNKVNPTKINIDDLYFPTKDKTQVFTTEFNKNQATILQGYKYKLSGNLKDDLVITLMNDILGGSTSSRLFNDLREKRHLAYHVDSMDRQDGNMGSITLRIGTTTENLETGEKSYDNIKKSIDGFNENINKICNEYVTEEELDTAKKALKNSILSATESYSEINSILSSNNQSYYGLNYTNEKFDMIDSITPQDIMNAARYVFAGKPVVSVAATHNTLEANKEYLKNLENN